MFWCTYGSIRGGSTQLTANLCFGAVNGNAASNHQFTRKSSSMSSDVEWVKRHQPLRRYLKASSVQSVLRTWVPWRC